MDPNVAMQNCDAPGKSAWLNSNVEERFCTQEGYGTVLCLSLVLPCEVPFPRFWERRGILWYRRYRFL